MQCPNFYISIHIKIIKLVCFNQFPIIFTTGGKQLIRPTKLAGDKTQRETSKYKDEWKNRNINSISYFKWQTVIATRGTSKVSKSFTAQFGLCIFSFYNIIKKLLLSITLRKERIINGF